MKKYGHILLFVALLTDGSAIAQSGALEINQLCVATGCFTGDDPGYPVTLTQEGRSYVMTSDLQAQGTLNVIVVSAIGITLDMQGHSIRGPVICNGVPVTDCENDPGFGTGISVLPVGAQHFTVRNGSIYGMSEFGIDIFEGGPPNNNLIENISISDTGFTGMFAYGAIVRNVTVSRNGNAGIEGSTETFVSDSVVSRNGGRGIGTAYCINVVSINNGDTDGCLATTFSTTSSSKEGGESSSASIRPDRR